MTILTSTTFENEPLGEIDINRFPDFTRHTAPSGQPGALRIVRASDGQRVLRATVFGSGDNTSYRSELNGANGPAPTSGMRNWTTGQDFWWTVKVRLRRAAQDGQNGRFSILQVHQENNNSLSPPMVVEFNNGQWVATCNYSRVAGITSNNDLILRKHTLGPATIGVVDVFKIRYSVDKLAADTIEIYRNDVLVMQQVDVPTAYNIVGDVYMKIGIYAYPWTGGSGGPATLRHVVDYYGSWVADSAADVSVAPVAGIDLSAV